MTEKHLKKPLILKTSFDIVKYKNQIITETQIQMSVQYQLQQWSCLTRVNMPQNSLAHQLLKCLMHRAVADCSEKEMPLLYLLSYVHSFFVTTKQVTL